LKLVTFDLASPYGFFRKNFSTTNALTFAVIPRSACEGLIACIVGLSRTDFPSLLKNSKIAVELMSPVRKMPIKYMHTNEEWWNETLSHYLSGRQFVLQKVRAQIAVPESAEFLVNPAYRIYVDTTNEEINKQLLENLKNKQSHYTPYLGGSSMICSLKFVGEFDYEYISNGEYLPMSSIIPYTGRMPKIRLEKNSTFATEEDLAIHMDNERRSSGTYSVVYATKPGKILVCDKATKPGKILVCDKDIVKVRNGMKDLYIKFI
jgi:CRISPR-associated protein Cas5h